MQSPLENQKVYKWSHHEHSLYIPPSGKFSKNKRRCIYGSLLFPLEKNSGIPKPSGVIYSEYRWSYISQLPRPKKNRGGGGRLLIQNDDKSIFQHPLRGYKLYVFVRTISFQIFISRIYDIFLPKLCIRTSPVRDFFFWGVCHFKGK